MTASWLDARAFPYSPRTRWRFRFYVLWALVTTLLIGWGGFVTSIDAGLAVPDWPSTFNSYDPFNPWPEWWTLTPILAEHGHRLLGALVGLLTIVVAVWTWRADPRAWMRRLGVFALVLVIVQGTLGGLRVVLISLDLAMVHAAVAQIFFAITVAMALFTSRGWLEAREVLVESVEASRMRRLASVTVGVLYLQILLGALLRHPGTGLDPLLAALHIGGAFLATWFIAACLAVIWWRFRRFTMLVRAATAALILLFVQIGLGLLAYFVNLNDRGEVIPSNLQVVVNTSHLVIGALLFVSIVVIRLLVARASRFVTPAGTHSRPVLEGAAPV
jgi:heme a synthase